MKMYAYEGQMMSVGQACKLCGLSENTVRGRMDRYGCSLEEAIKMPKGKYLPKYDYHGEQLTREEIAARAGVSVKSLAGYMYRYGLSAVEAADFLIACDAEYDYAGGRKTLKAIADITHINLYSLYAMVVLKGMSPDEIERRAIVPGGKISTFSVARTLCGEIFNGVVPELLGFREDNRGVFHFGSVFYRYEVSFPGPKCARMTAIYRDPERGEYISSIWDYAITKDSIQYKGRRKTWN